MKRISPTVLRKIYFILGIASVCLIFWVWYFNQDVIHRQTLIKKIESLHQLGQFYANKGQHQKARQCFYDAFELGEGRLGKEESVYLSCLNYIAWIEKQIGNYSQSFELFKTIYATRVQLYGEEDPITINVLINLATLQFFAGNFAESVELYNKAILLRTKAFGEDNLYTLYSHANLASVYRLNNNFDASLEILLKVLPKIEKKYGKQHTGTKFILRELSLTYLGMGKLSEAEYILHKILIHSSYSSLDDFHRVRTNLAYIYREMEIYDEALYHQKIVLQERQEFYGYSDLLTAAVHLELAQTYVASGDSRLAYHALTQARLISQNKLGAAHPWRMEIEAELLGFLRTNSFSNSNEPLSLKN